MDRRAKAIALGVIVFLVLATIPAWLQPARPRTDWYTLVCVSNLKQIGLGIQVYAKDNDDSLPPSNTWMDALQPIMHREGAFTCEAAAHTVGVFGYAFNRTLSGAKNSVIELPSVTPETYDSSNLTRNASDPVTSLPAKNRHPGGSNVLYADTHVRPVDVRR